MNTNPTYLKESGYDKLKKLSSVKSSGFKITGDEKLFTIIIGNERKLIFFIISILLILIVYILTNIDSKVLFWSFIIIIFFWTSMFFLYLDLKKEIIVDSEKRIITIKQEPLVNVIRKLPIIIAFADVKDFSVKKTSLTRNGITTSYYKSGLNSHHNVVYINFKNNSLRLIDLNAGPYYYVDQDIFIKSLTKIIK